MQNLKLKSWTIKFDLIFKRTIIHQQRIIENFTYT